MTLFTCFLAVFPNAESSALQVNIEMSSEPPAIKMSRRPRLNAETLALEEVERRFPVIMGRLDSRVTVDAKNRAWKEVTAYIRKAERKRISKPRRHNTNASRNS